MCIFCKIVNNEIPSDKVYEDEKMIIIKDINPQAKKHYLMIPKAHFADISEMSKENALLMADCFMKLATMVDELGLEDGFRLVSNKGVNGCQTVPHLHIHILGGEKLDDKMC